MGDDTNPTATSKINLLAHPNTRKDTTDDHRSHQRLLIANERTSRTARST
jgi:ribosomal protein S10